MDKLLTPSEAAERLNVRERTIRRWIFLRKIEYAKVGALVRIPEREVNRIVEEGTVKRLPKIAPPRLPGDEEASNHLHLRDASCCMGPDVIEAAAAGSRSAAELVEGWRR